jgi:WD40 repeat protein
LLPLQGHTTIVWSLAFSPDGKMLATGSADQTLRLWNLTTGKEEAKLIGHGSEVWTVAFAPDGQTLASGGKDKMVMLWSTAPKPAELVITNVHLPPSFSPDNKLLATAKLGGPVTVWNAATRQPVWVLHSETFSHFPNEGGTLATLSTNRILRYWDVATQTLQRAVPLPGITYQRFGIAMSGNRLAAAGDDGIISLRDTMTGAVIWNFSMQKGTADGLFDGVLAFSPNARLLATSGEDQPVKLWEVATQKELASGRKRSVYGLGFSPDGSLLASAGWDDTVEFLSVATGKAESPLTGIKEGCAGVAFTPDGRTLAVACEDGTVRLWNLATRREVAVLRHGKAPLRFVVFSSDGQTLVSVCGHGTMRFWDAPSPADL